MVNLVTNLQLAILSLYRMDYARQLHVRAMATELGVSHTALLPHLGTLERLSVIAHRTDGRNNVFTLTKNAVVRDYLTLCEKIATLDALKKPATRNIYDLAAGTTACVVQTGTNTLVIGDAMLAKRLQHKRHIISLSAVEFMDALRTGAFREHLLRDHIILSNHDFFIMTVWGASEVILC